MWTKVFQKGLALAKAPWGKGSQWQGTKRKISKNKDEDRAGHTRLTGLFTGTEFTQCQCEEK